MEENKQVKCYMVDTSSQAGDLVQVVKKILQSANITQSQIDSFMVSSKDFNQEITPILKSLEKVSATELVKILSEKPEAVVYFRNHAAEARLLQETNTNSKLFTNMTPSVLSGLFVALFLIIVLIIGISCLYDIKTNDKFARNQLWVGKESWSNNCLIQYIHNIGKLTNGTTYLLMNEGIFPDGNLRTI